MKQQLPNRWLAPLADVETGVSEEPSRHIQHRQAAVGCLSRFPSLDRTPESGDVEYRTEVFALR